MNFAALTITSYTPYKTDDVDPDGVAATQETYDFQVLKSETLIIAGYEAIKFLFFISWL